MNREERSQYATGAHPTRQSILLPSLLFLAAGSVLPVAVAPVVSITTTLAILVAAVLGIGPTGAIGGAAGVVVHDVL